MLPIGLVHFGLVLGSRLDRVEEFRTSPNGPKRFKHYNKNKKKIIIKSNQKGQKCKQAYETTIKQITIDNKMIFNTDDTLTRNVNMDIKRNMTKTPT